VITSISKSPTGIRSPSLTSRWTNVAGAFSEIAAHPEVRERFLREVRAAARLRHSNVASVFYYGSKGVTQLGFKLQHDDSFTIGAVRHLDEHWSELKPLLEAEGLELLIAAVEAPRIPQPKASVTNVNVLGSLSEPVRA
jgi:hypothetical protein